MSVLIAFLVAFVIGYFVLLDEDPHRWWIKQMQNWYNWVSQHTGFGALATWGMTIGVPAAIVAGLDALLSNLYLDFFLSLAVLLLCTGMTSFMRSYPKIIKAVYSNNSSQAAEIANQWNLRSQQIEDSPDHFVPRLLALCASRLHEDVLAVLLWFVLLGPAGAVLATANFVYAHSNPEAPLAFNPIEKVAAVVSIVIFGISGNMGPALASLSGLRPDSVALAAGNINPQRISLEEVPKFGKLLHRAFVVGSVGTVAALLVIA